MPEISSGYITTFSDDFMYYRCEARGPQYFAGLFDGEGCIRLSRHLRDQSVSYEPVAKVVMTSREVVEAFSARYGGRVRDQNTSQGGRKQAYIWRIGAKTAVLDFLREVSPWLIEKRAQATTLIEYLEGISLDGSDSIDPEAVSVELSRLKRME